MNWQLVAPAKVVATRHGAATTPAIAPAIRCGASRDLWGTAQPVGDACVSHKFLRKIPETSRKPPSA